MTTTCDAIKQHGAPISKGDNPSLILFLNLILVCYLCTCLCSHIFQIWKIFELTHNIQPVVNGNSYSDVIVVLLILVYRGLFCFFITSKAHTHEYLYPNQGATLSIEFLDCPSLVRLQWRDVSSKKRNTVLHVLWCSGVVGEGSFICDRDIAAAL